MCSKTYCSKVFIVNLLISECWWTEVTSDWSMVWHPAKCRWSDIDQWRVHVNARVKAKGKHIENMLWCAVPQLSIVCYETYIQCYFLFHSLQPVMTFYRAMHFSAKRGIAIACRLSVCMPVRLSVTLVDCDHIGWNTSEMTSPLVSLGCSLSADPNIMGLLQGEHPQIWAQSDPPPVDLSVEDMR